ncbi:MAG: patatin-like phospholipase family protein [Candidatus Thiodiazotropha sp.]
MNDQAPGQNPKNIALALSGGGVRAMVYHLGVIRYLAKQKRLEDVGRLSTVSGGSLVTGLIFKVSGMYWPSSEQYLNHVYPQLREMICSRSMQWRALLQLLKPWNFRFILSRANLLALELEHGWDIHETLSMLPKTPEWSINGTTAENGKRFRFKRDNMGDYRIGYSTSEGFPLSNAMAISAAFPGGIGPLTINAGKLTWQHRPYWDAPKSDVQVIDNSFRRLRLYDGGVYDNLGLEPFFDAGKSTPKNRDESIIVSDASTPLAEGFSYLKVNPWRLKRIVDIITDQSRSLRVRTFVSYLVDGGEGMYLYINTPVSGGETCESAKYAATYPTTLNRVTKTDFDAIAGHGYRVSSFTESTYGCKY